eukprot:2423906-Prymnesium_polylepis.1
MGWWRVGTRVSVRCAAPPSVVPRLNGDGHGRGGPRKVVEVEQLGRRHEGHAARTARARERRARVGCGVGVV